MQEITLKVQTINSDTVLSRVIESIKRRRIPIQKLVAAASAENKDCGTIEILILSDIESARALRAKISSIIDVLEVE